MLGRKVRMVLTAQIDLFECLAVLGFWYLFQFKIRHDITGNQTIANCGPIIASEITPCAVIDIRIDHMSRVTLFSVGNFVSSQPGNDIFLAAKVQIIFNLAN